MNGITRFMTTIVSCFFVCVCMCVCACTRALSHVQFFVIPGQSSPPDSFVHEIFPSKNTGMDCHFLFQGVFLTQGSNSHLYHAPTSCLLYVNLTF